MKIPHSLYALLFVIIPLSLNARQATRHVSEDMTFSVQKKYSPVVGKALELMMADIDMTAAKGKAAATSLQVFQLDMANNKELKALSQMTVPAMDIIAHKDAFWIGSRMGKTVVVGSNGRGTAYGIMRFAQKGGSGFDQKGETHIPSVEYRGISLEGHQQTNYRQLFGQMLRQRANLLCEGWDRGEASGHFAHDLRALADTFGIVLATPHGSHGLKLQGEKKTTNVNIGWADDNYGYMAPASDDPDDDCGAVYHLAYSGTPHSYLWLCTTQPGLLANEMGTAFDRGAKRLWMCVVHNPYVAAYQLSLFLDMAWNIKAVDRANVGSHLNSWLANNFGQRAANALMKPLAQYFRLTNIRRPEMMDFTMQKTPSKHNKNGDGGIANTDFNAEEFGNELERYLNHYKQAADKVTDIRRMIAAEDSDKYFTMIEYPVRASALMAVKTLEAQESRLIARPVSFHHDSEALESASRSIRAYRNLQGLTSLCNNALARMGLNVEMNAAPQGLTVFGKPLLTDTLSEKEIHQYGNYTHGDVHMPTLKAITSLAASYTSASKGARAINMLGRSMRAVTINAGDSLTYRFTSGTIGGTLRLAFVPTHALDGGMSQAEVKIDGGTPRTVIITDGMRSERWMKGVLRGQALINLPVALEPGSHTLTIKALNDHVTFDEWMIDDDSDRQFYVFPIEPRF